jgi:hypothetical protein
MTNIIIQILLYRKILRSPFRPCVIIKGVVSAAPALSDCNAYAGADLGRPLEKYALCVCFSTRLIMAAAPRLKPMQQRRHWTV